MKTATGKVIKAFRICRKYKQEFVANKMNITVQALSNIERGKVCLDIEKLYYFSKLFKVPYTTVLAVSVEVFETGTDEWLASSVKALLHPFGPEEGDLK